jgi:hypothetical protein
VQPSQGGATFAGWCNLRRVVQPSQGGATFAGWCNLRRVVQPSGEVTLAERCSEWAAGKGFTPASPFIKKMPVKGCFAYSAGPLKGFAFFGIGGTIADMRREVQPPLVRPATRHHPSE